MPELDPWGAMSNTTREMVLTIANFQVAKAQLEGQIQQLQQEIHELRQIVRNRDDLIDSLQQYIAHQERPDPHDPPVLESYQRRPTDSGDSSVLHDDSPGGVTALQYARSDRFRGRVSAYSDPNQSGVHPPTLRSNDYLTRSVDAAE